MALPLSLAWVSAFANARPLKCSHTHSHGNALPLQRRKGACLGWSLPKKHSGFSVPCRYTWPIRLTNGNVCPLTCCFCSACAPVSQAPPEGRELLLGFWGREWVPGFTGSYGRVDHKVEADEKHGVRTRERVMWAASARSALSTQARGLWEHGCVQKRWN